MSHFAVIIFVLAFASLTFAENNTSPRVRTHCGLVSIEIADFHHDEPPETRVYLGGAMGIKRRVQFSRPEQLSQFKPGKHTCFTGRAQGNNLMALSSIEVLGPSTQVPSASTAAITGDKSVLAIIVDFEDQEVDGSTEEIDNMMFNTEPTAPSVSNYYYTTSKGLLSLTGNTIRVTVPTNLEETLTCDYGYWAASASSLALDQLGLAIFSYQHRVFFLPYNAPCYWNGLAQLNGSRSWIRYNVYGSPLSTSHELGHNFGMGHASSLFLNQEYGDGSDVMGHGFIAVNAPHSVQMGWTPPSQVETITQSNRYLISSLDLNITTYTKVYKIYRPTTNDHYFISYRTRSGLFTSGLSALHAERINIHYHRGGGNNTYFVTSIGYNETFLDAANNIKIRVDNVDSESAAITAIFLTGGSSGSGSGPSLPANFRRPRTSVSPN